MQVLSSLNSGLKTLVDTLKNKPTNAESIKSAVARKYGVMLSDEQIKNITDEVAVNVVGDIALAIDIEFTNGTNKQVVNLTDYPLSVKHNGLLYRANHLLKTISNFNSTTEISSRGITLTLSAIDKTIYDQVFAYGYMNAPIKVYLAYVDKHGESIGAISLFNGFIETVKFVNDGIQPQFDFTVNNIYGRLDKTSGKRPANSVQHLIDPTDKGFEWTARTKAEEKWKAE